VTAWPLPEWVSEGENASVPILFFSDEKVRLSASFEAANIAVREMAFAGIAKEYEDDDETDFPAPSSHPVNANPAKGLATTVTEDPYAYSPPPETRPLASSPEDTVSLYEFADSENWAV